MISFLRNCNHFDEFNRELITFFEVMFRQNTSNLEGILVWFNIVFSFPLNTLFYSVRSLIFPQTPSPSPPIFSYTLGQQFRNSSTPSLFSLFDSTGSSQWSYTCSNIHMKERRSNICSCEFFNHLSIVKILLIGLENLFFIVSVHCLIFSADFSEQNFIRIFSWVIKVLNIP